MKTPSLAPIALALAAFAFALPAHAGKTLDAVKARGQLVCGVNTSGPGFSTADSQGKLDRASTSTSAAPSPPPC